MLVIGVCVVKGLYTALYYMLNNKNYFYEYREVYLIIKETVNKGLLLKSFLFVI